MGRWWTPAELDFQSVFALNGSVKLIPKVARILKEAGIPLFLITFLGVFLDQWLTATLEAELMAPNGATGLIWLWGAFSILINLLYPLLIMIFVLSSLAQQRPLDFVAKYFSPSLREQLRSWGKSVWWSLLLIVPGIVKFVQYTFVPFVVCLLPEYQEGGLDALKKSEALVKKVALRLVAVLVVFIVILPLLLTSFEEYRLFLVHPATSLVFVGVEVILNVVMICFIFDLFMRSVHEPDVSVERS